MSRKKSEGKAERKRFSAEFKHQALLRAVRDGVPAVARDLGLEPVQLYAWRAKAQQQGEDAETQRLQQSETSGHLRDTHTPEFSDGFPVDFLSLPVCRSAMLAPWLARV